jgi:indolepyruvate ferredoxin oxidoreductase, beta subunit
MIISVEPMESLRYLPMLAPNGWLVTNTTTFVNIPNYPDKDALMAEFKKLSQYITLDADHIAKELGSVKAANMVVLGAATPFINIEYELMENAIRQLFGKKGDSVINLNLSALKAGREFTESKL